MRLTVTARIVGGYATVLLLAAGILFTGLLGIKSISEDLNGVTGRAMPMQVSAGRMVATLLQAQVDLVRFHEATSTKTLDKIERAYRNSISQNADALDVLTGTTQENVDLAELLGPIVDAKNQAFAAGNAVIESHRSALKSAGVVTDQRAEFSDMGDEIISYASDLEGAAHTAGARKAVGELMVLLDNASTVALSALDEALAMAVMGAESEMKADFSEMNKLLTRIKPSPGISGSKELARLEDSYARFKTATGRLLTAYIDELNKRSATRKSMSEAGESSQLALAHLDELASLISDLTDEIESTAQDTVASSRSMILGFAVLALITSGLIGYLVTQSIRKPLNETVNVIREVATGDLRQTFNVTGSDELGTLARSMQELVTQLRGMVQDIGAHSDQLASTAEESAAISEQSFGAVSSQKEQTELVATAIEEMTATVEEVARNIHNTLTQVESAHGEVQDGERVLNENILNIKHLAGDIDQAATVIERLNEDSDNIGSVLDVIRGVAEQTNLLALNAAIEAARAGEQGRGFAVVADEVRTLASRTNDSTAEIQEMIQRLQDGTREAVDAMTRSREEAQSSVSGIAQAGEMLQSIASAITTIKDMSHQIASASEEQSSATQEQHRNIIAIAEASEQTAQGAQENQSASHELARMAEMQRTLIAKFKV